jgi:hypothetical protein
MFEINHYIVQDYCPMMNNYYLIKFNNKKKETRKCLLVKRDP